jgi:AcrR family transcriptional regulator
MGVTAGAEDPQRSELARTIGARERILDAAYELFSRHGIHAVGIDRIIAEAEVAKATLYNHFPSKEALVVAFLQLREERWTHGWLENAVERLAATPQDRALAIFDAFDEWFRLSDFEGCAFINTLLEISDTESAVHIAAVRHLAVLRGIFEGYAEQAGVSDPQETAYQLQILAMGAIVSAGRGDLAAARRARPLAAALLANSR